MKSSLLFASAIIAVTASAACMLVAKTPEARPSYEALSKVYKKDKHENCPDIATSENQCAIRVSRAMIDAKLKIDGDYKGKKCAHGYARGAQDLGAYLELKWGVHDQGYSKPGKLPAKLKGKKGVIMFAKIPTFPEGQGHIDLFNGEDGLTGTYWEAETIWFWELK